MQASKDGTGRLAQTAEVCTPAAPAADEARDLTKDRPKDRLYMLQDGMVYFADSISTRLTSRYAACVLLSLGSQDLELTVRSQGHRQRAVAIRPLLERGLRSDTTLCSVQIWPTHPLFRRFRAIANPGFLTLPFEVFADLRPSLLQARQQRASIEQAYELLEGVIDRTLPHLPVGKRNDPRIERALQVLRVNPSYPLTELAPKLQISSDHLSRLFAQVVGLPWRSYMLWQKVRNAAFLIGQGCKLTEVAIRAGFVDSAHLSKTWQQAFGGSPSYFFHGDRVQIISDPHLLEARYLDVDDRALGLEAESMCPHCGAPLKE